MPQIYNPEIPLHQQVKKVAGGRDTLNPVGIPFSYGLVTFEPLEINGKTYEIALKSVSDVKSEDGKVYIYDKLTFIIKEQNSDFLKQDIPVDEIEGFMQELYRTASIAAPEAASAAAQI